MENIMVGVGGWTPYRELTDKDKEIFKDTEKNLGVRYSPKSVSTQVVAGTNYRFKCTASRTVLHPQEYEVVVQIYQPLKGKPHITSIIPLN